MLILNKRGFTLIEILVVIAMIGVLASVIYPVITRQMDKPKKSRATIEIKTMKNAMDMYFAENNSYPTEKTDIIGLMKENGVLGGKFGTADAVDPWGRSYYITTNTTTYTIWSEGPDDSDTAKDDLYTDQTKNDITVNTVNLETSTAKTNSSDSGTTT